MPPLNRNKLDFLSSIFAAFVKHCLSANPEQKTTDALGLQCISVIRSFLTPGVDVTGIVSESTREKFLRLDKERKEKKAAHDKQVAAWRAAEKKPKEKE